MTRTVKAANEFPNLNLSVIETIFSSAGEVIESSFANPINKDFIKYKTFIFRGGKRIEFPGTDQESFTFFSPSIVGPGPRLFDKQYFKVTILEDDTRDYCVHTSMNYSINASIIDMSVSDYLDITKGCLIYVHGMSYKLNDIICTESELFALENNDAKITATDSCKVYIFRAILKDY